MPWHFKRLKEEYTGRSPTAYVVLEKVQYHTTRLQTKYARRSQLQERWSKVLPTEYTIKPCGDHQGEKEYIAAGGLKEKDQNFHQVSSILARLSHLIAPAWTQEHHAIAEFFQVEVITSGSHILPFRSFFFLSAPFTFTSKQEARSDVDWEHQEKASFCGLRTISCGEYRKPHFPYFPPTSSTHTIIKKFVTSKTGCGENLLDIVWWEYKLVKPK